MPGCVAGCPAQVEIPQFLRAFAAGDIASAYGILQQRNVLPEMCGYVCPAECQCENGCLEKIFSGKGLPIRDIQLVVCKLARWRGLTGVRLPEQASGKEVAVIGAGPAGLACAIRLLELGHSVAIYDRAVALGGTPQMSIPAFRYAEADEIDAILAPASEGGRLRLFLGKTFGVDYALEQLRANYDAVFIGIGLADSEGLGKAKGVMGATAFLKLAKEGKPPVLPPAVAVLGGGNTAMDAALVAKRLGCRDVYLVYRRSFAEMPAWPTERDSALAEGVHFLLLAAPLGYDVDSDGNLIGVRICRTELGEPDQSGRRQPRNLPKTESLLRVGMAIEAFGQGVAPEIRRQLAALDFTPDNLLDVHPETMAASLAGVFAGGDIVNGGATVVQSVVEGMRAAGAIDVYLRSAKCAASPANGQFPKSDV